MASVLPHGAFTVTFSAFRSALDQVPVVDPDGEIVGFGPGSTNWYGSGSFAVGLLDRLELGLSFQDVGRGEESSLLGAFGRLALMRPRVGGIGLAVGGRYLRPGGEGAGLEPGRLGVADPRLVERPDGGRDAFRTRFSPYLVATGGFQGPTSNLFPAYDVTLSVGVGGGTFSEGADLPFYAAGNSDGWFVGSAIHLGLGTGRLLTLQGEYNGFEVNAGLWSMSQAFGSGPWSWD